MTGSEGFRDFKTFVSGISKTVYNVMCKRTYIQVALVYMKNQVNLRIAPADTLEGLIYVPCKTCVDSWYIENDIPYGKKNYRLNTNLYNNRCQERSYRVEYFESAAESPSTTDLCWYPSEGIFLSDPDELAQWHYIKKMM